MIYLKFESKSYFLIYFHFGYFNDGAINTAQECGHKAAFYHGSIDPPQRAFVQKQWSKDEINIICATVAFGMGIVNVYLIMR